MSVAVTVIEITHPASTSIIEVTKLGSADTIAAGSRVYVANDCPFRGLRGTILKVYLFEASSDEEVPDEPCGVCLVQLDGVPHEPIELPLDTVEIFTPIATR